ncbi:MAG: phosphoribosylformylglycinamidine synthase subunit PurQ [Armatimonadetes bacterium]|nr:phosphoribosylformylglycinamidine synthase subunit PurQ [Armatimonadota bacterium]
MKFGVVTFPGSNCDRDCLHVAEHVLRLPAHPIWYAHRVLPPEVDCVILPGGFAYGDYLRAGAIAATAPIMPAIREFAGRGGPVLGICNGFQVLVESGLLPGAMLRNRSLRFICTYVHVRVESVNTPFTASCRPGQVLRLPIAHAEGNYYVPPPLLEDLRARGQIVFRYCDPDGGATPDANPNGALDGIAGVCNTRGNVVGLMPHPERCSEAILGSEDGRIIFESALRHAAAAGAAAVSAR